MRAPERPPRALPEAMAFAFPPPAIPGVGTAGGMTFMLRIGRARLRLPGREQNRFLEAARKRPEFARLFTPFIPAAPQHFADVDREKVLKQGVDLCPARSRPCSPARWHLRQ